MADNNETGMALFGGKEIRRVWYQDQWWFVILDVVALLSESKNPSGYLKDMRKRDKGLSENWGSIAVPIEIETAGGPQRVNCANVTGCFRVIQSIPSAQAEPFKQWLAEVAGQRIEELENPELAIERMREDYRTRGYPEDWIIKRIQSIDIRKTLTNEWHLRGVEQGLEFSILTAEIAQKTFGVNPSEHKAIKGLKRENLRDHMTDLELIFTMLGEAGTVQEAKNRDAFGFHENRDAAIEGGTAAGKAREAYELESGRRIVSATNRKDQIKAARQEQRMRLKNKD